MFYDLHGYIRVCSRERKNSVESGMDVERVQRLGSLVAIGVASQLSAEFMRSRSSTHSFWILIGVSLVMMVIQVVFKQLLEFKNKINVNWHPWVTILAQTMMGLETIVWTLYGSATGQCKGFLTVFDFFSRD